MSESEELRRARERLEEKERNGKIVRERLAALHLDGPHPFPGAGSGGFGTDALASMFGGATERSAYCVCLICGAMVLLNDPEELVEGMIIERSVRIHTGWHNLPVTDDPPAGLEDLGDVEGSA